jgi:hypothetical protein
MFLEEELTDHYPNNQTKTGRFRIKMQKMKRKIVPM